MVKLGNRVGEQKFSEYFLTNYIKKVKCIKYMNYFLKCHNSNKLMNRLNYFKNERKIKN